MHTRRFKLLASVLVAGGLLFLLMATGGVGPRQVASTVASLPPGAYLAALGLHLCTYLLRGLRFWVLIPAARRPGCRSTLLVSAAHNMASYLLPAKMGEAAFPVYMRLQCGLPSTVGLATLLVARFLDAAMLCTGLATACWVLQRSGRYPGLDWLGLVGSVLVLATLFFLLLSLRGDLLLRALNAALRWMRVHHWSFGERVLQKSNALVGALRATASGGRFGVALLLTAPLWFTVYGFYAVLARAMGFPPEIGLLETGFGASLAAAFNLLPVNGFAGVGTQELGWVTGFHQFLGLDYDLSLRVGFGVHLIQVSNIVAVGLLAHLGLGLLPARALAELEHEDESSATEGGSESADALQSKA